MAYEDINVGDSLADSFTKLKARDDALRSWEFGTEPTSPVAYQVWVDTANSKIKRRNAANSAWIDVTALLDQIYDNKDERSTTTARTANLNMGSNRVVSMADPVGAQDGVTKQFLADNSAGEFRLAVNGIRSAITLSDMTWNNENPPNGFTLQNNNTEIVVNNTGLYLIALTIHKRAGVAMDAKLEEISPGSVTHMRIKTTDTAEHTYTHVRTMVLTSGDIVRVRDLGGSNAFDNTDTDFSSLSIISIRV